MKRLKPQARGFTLIEVLVALAIMAALASLAWQGLDGILRAREGSRDSIDATVRLATVLTQWEQDLQAVYDTGGVVPAISFDGATLRLTRRTEAGVMLVAWSVRGGLWQRWTSPPVTRSRELQEQWLRSQQLVGKEPGHLTVAENATLWQVYFNRGGQWTNAQSTGDFAQTIVNAAPPAAAASPATTGTAPGGSATTGTATDPANNSANTNTGTVNPANQAVGAAVQQRELLPDAVRLQITLAGRVLTRDIVVGVGGS